jgi:dTDP-4-dehydrorhamnose reductase
LLVTGAHGFVAGSVIAQARDFGEVHVVTRGAPLIQWPGLEWHHLDPTDQDRLTGVFQACRPDVVIHAAAIADIDFSETHPKEAHSINVEFTRLLAELCTQRGARLVFCSTDAVFDGEQAPYDEDAAPSAVNVYARTKIEAERIVAGLGDRGVIARLALVIGLPVLGSGNSFLPKLLRDLRAGRQVRGHANEVRTPIDVITLGRALLELAGSAHTGIFHLGGNEAVNRFEMGRRIATHFGLSPELVIVSDSSLIPGRARRSRDVSLNNAKARAALRTPMLGLDDGLKLIQQTVGAFSP